MAHVYTHTLPVGARIESYDVTSVLGVGGFGITYKAYDSQLECDVAIKEYLPADIAVRNADGISVSVKTAADSESYEHGLKRFLDEARTLAKFHEPNIVRVTRYLEANGTAYFVMEYEEGEPLSHRLQRLVSLHESAITAVALPILQGLRAVHARSFLHRDIKPANIYLRTDNSPVLIDFGAAREALGEHSRHMTGMVTHGYAPFEQYSPNGKQGPWTDLYALGATLYHCATGVAPPAAPERIAALHEGRPDPVRQVHDLLAGKYTPGFLDALRWMMAPLAADRPQNVEDVMNALHAGTDQVQGRIASTSSSRDSPAAIEKTVMLGSGDPAEVSWRPEALQLIEISLERYIGPLAHILVRKMASSTISIERLTEQLSRFIPSETKRLEFLSTTRQEITTGSARRSTPAPTSSSPAGSEAAPTRASPPTSSAAKFEPAVLLAAERALATYIGPMARVLVKQAAGAATDLDDLYRRLAGELQSAEHQQAFLSAVRGQQ